MIIPLNESEHLKSMRNFIAFDITHFFSNDILEQIMTRCSTDLLIPLKFQFLSVRCEEMNKFREIFVMFCSKLSL